MEGTQSAAAPKKKTTVFGFIVQLIFLFLALVGVVTILVLYALIRYGNPLALPDRKHDGIVAMKYDTVMNSVCNVSGIELHGAITTYIPDDETLVTEDSYDTTSSEDIMSLIEHAELEPQIKAILIEVDSYGGYPVAAEEIANAIKWAEKPVVAYVRGMGLSAAYWGISSADQIFASEVSDVGSIGVTRSYLDNSKENEDLGRTYNEISSGVFKNTGDPDKSLSEAEKELLLRDVLLTNDVFVREVAENRGLEPSFVSSIADGSSVMGAKALEYGLIDGIGGHYEALAKIEELIGEPTEVCW